MIFARPVLLAAIAITLSACQRDAAEMTPPPPASPALLKVNGELITQSMVDSLLRQRGQAVDPTPADQSNAVGDIEKVLLMAQEGKRRQLDQSPEFLADMQLLTLSRLADFTADKALKDKPVTDEEVRAEYDSRVAQIGGQEFEVKQMLFKEEAQALTAIGELLTGADFAATATAQTAGKDGAQTGDLGWINLAQVPKEFAPVLPSLKAGEFTKTPVKSEFGYHVLKVNAVRGLSPPNFDEVAPGVRQALEKQRVDALLNQLKTDGKIEPVTG
jgi:peptidyl-prolyl cis-trans isomerase C